jgi:hypothetical protein
MRCLGFVDLVIQPPCRSKRVWSADGPPVVRIGSAIGFWNTGNQPIEYASNVSSRVVVQVGVAILGTKEELIGTLEQVLADANDMLEFASKVKQEFIDGINVTQDQVYIRAIAVDFFTSHVVTVAEWAERSLEEVDQWDDLEPSAEKNERGLERIRQTPVTTIGHALAGVATPPSSQTRTLPHRR